jgi:predicted glycoside hydrolase/deacetylase ChbG (UPF0249 family)
MPEPRIRLVTRGDDCGSSRAANAAIQEAAERGILRNVGVMAPGPAFDEAAAMLKRLEGVSLGLHATITDEWHQSRWGPVLGAAKVPTLVLPDGTFFKDTRPLWEHAPRPDLGEIVAELKAQLERMRSKGLRVDYMDTHMGFDWFPGLKDRLRALAAAEGLLWQPPDLAALPDLRGEFADPVERFLARLGAAEPGKTYLYVTHPACDTDAMRALTYGEEKPGAVARQRDWDRRTLTEPRVLEFCREHQVAPVRFTDVARPAGPAGPAR